MHQRPAGLLAEPACGCRAHTWTPFVITGPPLYTIAPVQSTVVPCSGRVLCTVVGVCRNVRVCAAAHDVSRRSAPSVGGGCGARTDPMHSPSKAPCFTSQHTLCREAFARGIGWGAQPCAAFPAPSCCSPPRVPPAPPRPPAAPAPARCPAGRGCAGRPGPAAPGSPNCAAAQTACCNLCLLLACAQFAPADTQAQQAPRRPGAAGQPARYSTTSAATAAFCART